VLDKLAMVGNKGEGLFLVDKDLGHMSVDGHSA